MDWYPLWNSLRIALVSCAAVFFLGIFAAYYIAKLPRTVKGALDVVRKVKESASLGVGGFGSLSLPVEGGLDSLVKVASNTVTEPNLYERFFDLLGGFLSKAVPPKAAEDAASAPAHEDKP